MKKLVFIVLTAFMVIASVLIIVIKPKPETISILSLENDYSRIITESEIFSVVLYFDSADSYLIEKNNISRISISDELNEIVLSAESIDIGKNLVSYKNKNYYEVTFNLIFDWKNLEGLNISFSQALLNINYINEVAYNFDIGNINLSFLSFKSPTHIDLKRMYGIINEIDDKKTIVAIALKLENLTNTQIIINKIYSNNVNIGFDLTNTITTTEVYPADKNITDIIPNYYSLNDLNEKEIYLNEDYFLIVPVLYSLDTSQISRLPLYIDYSYQDFEKTFIIDDFLFFNEGLNLNERQDDIHEYFYNYS